MHGQLAGIGGWMQKGDVLPPAKDGSFCHFGIEAVVYHHYSSVFKYIDFYEPELAIAMHTCMHMLNI